MRKRKKSNINALTNLIQTSKLTYAEIGKEVIKALSTLNIYDPTWDYYDPWDSESRISRLAQGNKPTAAELQALAFWQFGDANKWPYLYFPNDDETYNFIHQVFTQQINAVFNSKQNVEILSQKLSNYTKFNIRNGVEHKKITPLELTFVLLGLLNFKMKNEIILGKRKEKEDLQKYANDWFNNNIKPNIKLVNLLTPQLRDTLDLDHSKKRELKQVVLRGLISAL